MTYIAGFPYLLTEGVPCPPRVSRHDFRKRVGREPKMSGTLDYFEAMDAVDKDCEVTEVTCVGDDIESYIVTSGAAR